MPRKFPDNRLPRIACIGSEALTLSHGTGMMFARHFSKYPRSKVVDVHYQTFANRYHFQRIVVPRYELTYAPWNAPYLKNINMCLKGEERVPGTSLIYHNKVFEPININWDEYGGPPEIIYSTCFSAADFAFLHHVYRSLPKKVPIIQHFLDLDLTNYHDMVSLYNELLPAFVAVWALTRPIWYTVAQFSFKTPEMVQALHQPLEKNYEKKYQKFSKNFRPLMIGNIWSGYAFKTLQNLWANCQKDLQNLPAINWTGHPRRFTEHSHVNIDMTVGDKDPVIRNGGFLTNRDLKKHLKEADIAIVAFTGEHVDREHYTTFSLPSRIGDYCANGLPLVVLSRKGTEPWRLVEENKMGLTLDPSDLDFALKQLKNFILDENWRAECGKNARKFAEKELNLTTYQNALYPRLVALSRQKVHRAFLQSRFSR